MLVILGLNKKDLFMNKIVEDYLLKVKLENLWK